MCDTYLETIADALESNGKELQHFRCHDLFENGKTAKLAARALNRHLQRSGGRLGGFQIKMSDSKRRRHGILWRATKVNPMKAVVVKNGKM